MVALIGLLALFLNPLILNPNSQPLTPNPQVGSCPPCADQLPQGARWIATAAAGPDAAGLTETLVAYYVRDPAYPTIELGRVGALAVRASGGATQVYKLGEDFGETPYAELVARDLNRDGETELAVTGSVGVNSTLLHIFTWNGAGYSLVERFFGDSGVRLSDLDSDGVEEVVVGLRHYDRAQLRSDTILTWNGAGYTPDYVRWGFAFDDPSFKDYPEAAVLSYYRAVAARDFRTAFDLLGAGMRGGQSQATFEQGFATTRDVRVEDLEVLSEDATGATVRVDFSTVERDGTVNRYAGTWVAERLGGAWQLVGAYITGS